MWLLGWMVVLISFSSPACPASLRFSAPIPFNALGKPGR
jgi:hypothetical protein